MASICIGLSVLALSIIKPLLMSPTTWFLLTNFNKKMGLHPPLPGPDCIYRWKYVTVQTLKFQEIWQGYNFVDERDLSFPRPTDYNHGRLNCIDITIWGSKAYIPRPLRNTFQQKVGTFSWKKVAKFTGRIDFFFFTEGEPEFPL